MINGKAKTLQNFWKIQIKNYNYTRVRVKEERGTSDRVDRKIYYK